MKLNLIIEQLRAYCPSFVGAPGQLPRVAGAVEFSIVPESTALPVPCAFVLPLDDNPGASKAMNAVRQELVEGFAIVVALDNKSDERGQASGTALHDIRAELWKALLGWQPEPDYNGVVYEGGNLERIDRSRLWYRFEFSAQMEIGPSDGWEEGALQALPKLNEVRVKLDVIDPIVDRNIKPDGVGPDGRTEFEVRVENLNP